MPDKLLTLRDKIIQINNNESGSCKQLSVKYLSEVITCRMKEIVDACMYKIQESGFGGMLRNGIVLTGGCATIPNLSTFVKEFSGYNVRIGYPRQKFSFSGCPEINETGSTAAVGMILAAKEDKYLNCISESMPENEAPVYSDTTERLEEGGFEEVQGKETDSEEGEKKTRRKPKILWKNPFDAWTRKIDKMLDEGFSSCDE